MGIVQRFENRLEQAVSGAFARAFRSAVQPVELASALQREVDNSAQILSRNRRLAPNTFHIELGSVDYERLAPYADTLTAELCDMLREHAAEQHYVFTGPVSVRIEEATDLGTGRFRVRSRAAAQVKAANPASTGQQRAARVFVEVNGERHPLEPPGLLIGRGTEADLRVNDPGVSRRHAEIRVVGGGVRPAVSMVDLGSTNGTLVNGRRVDQAALEDGATVRVGRTDLTIRFSGEDEG